jgi:hypothetical protein
VRMRRVVSPRRGVARVYHPTMNNLFSMRWPSRWPSRWRVRWICLLVLLGPICVVASEPVAVSLVPYHAEYAVALRHDAARSNAGIAALKGRLEVRIEHSCDGWSTQQSMGFRMLGEDGSDLEHLAFFNAFEEHENHGFTFASRTWADRQLTEQVAGVVSRDVTNGPAMVRYSKPDNRQVQLSTQALFPSEHARLVLAGARAGKRGFMHIVFDGSSVDNPLQISSWIGDVRPQGRDSVGVLAQHRSWPVRLAYYALDATQALPQFEMSVALYDNGVAGDMVYDYGEFEVSVTLEELALLPIAQCG